jgi:hypothetical protein
LGKLTAGVGSTLDAPDSLCLVRFFAHVIVHNKMLVTAPLQQQYIPTNQDRLPANPSDLVFHVLQ